jgi:mRNA interferase MazF
MVTVPYIPDRGDIVWVDLNPIRGHEQANQRPALVLSPKSYNQKTHLCVVCPTNNTEVGLLIIAFRKERR